MWNYKSICVIGFEIEIRVLKFVNLFYVNYLYDFFYYFFINFLMKCFICRWDVFVEVWYKLSGVCGFIFSVKFVCLFWEEKKLNKIK